MTDDGDAFDKEQLDAGRIDVLLAKYRRVIVGRCVARLRGHPDAEDVAQDVYLRLLGEFHRGKRYGDVPYRVVVHQVIGWTLDDYFEGRPTSTPLPEDFGGGAAPPDEKLTRLTLASAFEQLPDGDRAVLTLRYIVGLEPAQIAEQLGKKPNAVYQSLSRGHTALREGWVYD
jgi:RNA polymerase sigma-70 factor, ECF subfamily